MAGLAEGSQVAMPSWTPEQLRAYEDRRSGIRAVQSKPAKRLPLDPTPAREETRWYGSAVRFEIVFTVYALYPCDWDGYDIKALQDFCVHAGIIPNDGWKTLSGRVVSRKAATKEEERTEIEVI